ncbi:MAG: DEAD/DEAH box helicase [Endozoicomonas sp.]
MFSRLHQRPLARAAAVVSRVEKVVPRKSWISRLIQAGVGLWRCQIHRPLWLYRRYIAGVHKAAGELAGLDERSFQTTVTEHRAALLREGCTTPLLIISFALIREAAGRTLGMYHFDSQLLGGLTLFHGNIAEMQTGEGKTLTATLPAAAAAMAGIPVHVVTVNDYLARRDLEEMAPVYRALGLTYGCIQSGMSVAERRAIYGCDVVYCTNKELVFDYLKDQLILEKTGQGFELHSARLKGEKDALGQLMLRGLHFAIVDEADSVMLDEARTPLIISADVPLNKEQVALFREVLAWVQGWETGLHFQVVPADKRIELLATGEQELARLAEEKGGYWSGTLRARELVRQALSALLLFEKDVHYLVRDGKVQIIDEHTGRVMADRQWEKGLHQLIELKEGCEVSAPRETLSRQTYQRFFNLYHHLGGMTGTAREVAGELWQVYQLPVVAIPTHRPNLRQHYGWQVLSNQKDKWKTVVDHILALKARHRAVLVGCGTVGASEALSQALQAKGLDHQLLNARQDEAEAEVVSQAGRKGQVTIATNMAGRGTDIKLCPEAKDSGGLHVILTECHDASRLDRQLEGRSARQGDPGSFQVVVAIDDEVIEHHRLPLWLCRWVCRAGGHQAGKWLLKGAQRRLEKRHAGLRKQLLRQEERLREQMIFTSGESG